MDNLTLAYLLIAVGILLLMAEIFLPTGGFLFLVASIALLAGVTLTFYYGDTLTGIIALLSVFVAVPAALTAMTYLWPRSALLSTSADDDATVANMPVLLELEQLRGRYGRAVSPLRPSGVAEFDGRRVDVLTEGFMVESGSWVRCVEVRAGKVIVRPVDAPDLRNLDAADWSSNDNLRI